MDELYNVPAGVRLESDEVRVALAAVSVSASSYVANGVLNHVFCDQRRGAKLFVVESDRSKRLTEVVGDTTLWCTVRDVAAAVAAAPALRSPVQLYCGEVTELVAA